MTMQEGQQKRGPGRPRLYMDDAERQAACRDRRNIRMAQGEAALLAMRRPTLASVKAAIDRLLLQAADAESVRAKLLAHLTQTKA